MPATMQVMLNLGFGSWPCLVSFPHNREGGFAASSQSKHSVDLPFVLAYHLLSPRISLNTTKDGVWSTSGYLQAVQGRHSRFHNMAVASCQNMRLETHEQAANIDNVDERPSHC
jgi:hypothetical protein